MLAALVGPPRGGPIGHHGKGKDMKWLTHDALPVVARIVRVLAPPVIGAALGLLADAGLLDGLLVARLQAVLSGL